MKTKILIPYLFVLFIFYGCSTPKFYNELHSAFLKDTPPSGNYKISEKRMTRRVLRKNCRHLKNSNHIILLVALYSEWNTKKFMGAVYDVTNEKYYSFDNGKNPLKRLIITEEDFHTIDDSFKFVIKNYIEGKVEYIKKLGELGVTSGINTTETIYEINLKEEKNEIHSIKSILFMDGKPTIDIEEE